MTDPGSCTLLTACDLISNFYTTCTRFSGPGLCLWHRPAPSIPNRKSAACECLLVVPDWLVKFHLHAPQDVSRDHMPIATRLC